MSNTITPQQARDLDCNDEDLKRMGVTIHTETEQHFGPDLKRRAVQPVNVEEIADEIFAWGQYNFDSHAPHLGLAEEVGELSHAILKRGQNIRGFGDPEVFKAAAKDALADATVFLLHWSRWNKTNFRKVPVYRAGLPADDAEVEQILVGHLFKFSGILICCTVEKVDPCPAATQIWSLLHQLASFYGFDLLRDCLVPVWSDVKTRDWRKFPINGRTE